MFGRLRDTEKFFDFRRRAHTRTFMVSQESANLHETAIGAVDGEDAAGEFRSAWPWTFRPWRPRQAAAVLVSAMWITNFALIYTFPFLFALLGAAGTFWLYPPFATPDSYSFFDSSTRSADQGKE
jgi:hypothetical protein